MSKGVGPNLFLNILPTLIGYLKNILLHLKQNIWWCGRRFCHVLWMDDTYKWKCGWKMKMDELFHEHSQQDKFQTKYKIFMFVYCEQFITWNVQVIVELVFQIPFLPSIFQLCSIPTIWNLRLNQIWWHINLLTHQKVCVNSNTTYPPQRSMQPLGIETISSTLGRLIILNFFKFSFVLSTPWQLA